MLIKINSHPCSGKTSFIKQHHGIYKGIMLLDFDDYDGINKTSRVLHEFNPDAVKTDVAMLGNNASEEKYGVEHSANIKYVTVLPPISDINRNITSRKMLGNNRKWSNEKKIYLSRENTYRLAVKYSEPIFCSFQDALDSLIIDIKKPQCNII